MSEKPPGVFSVPCNKSYRRKTSTSHREYYDLSRENGGFFSIPRGGGGEFRRARGLGITLLFSLELITRSSIAILDVNVGGMREERDTRDRVLRRSNGILSCSGRREGTRSRTTTDNNKFSMGTPVSRAQLTIHLAATYFYPGYARRDRAPRSSSTTVISRTLMRAGRAHRALARDGQTLSSLSTSIVLRFGNEAKRSRQVNGILAIVQQSEADNSTRLPVFFSSFFYQIASIALTQGLSQGETSFESNSGLIFHDVM